MKVLFLDVDGVLNRLADYHVVVPGDSSLRLNYKAMDRLNKIIEDTGCVVVLSSAWRLLGGGREFVEEFIPIHDVTDNGPGKRGGQIARWLENHPETTVYAIVDDDSDMLDSQLPHFFQTEFEHGLTDGIQYRITYHLNKGDEDGVE